MHALGIPTTRALAVVATGDEVAGVGAPCRFTLVALLALDLAVYSVAFGVIAIESGGRLAG